MKTIKILLTSLLVIISILFQSCNDEEKPQDVEIANEPIENLSKDPIFIGYLSILQNSLDISRVDLQRIGEIMQEYKNFDELEGSISAQQLAIAFGFTNFADLVDYSDNGNQLRTQLELKYNLSGYSWESLKPFYSNELEKRATKPNQLGSKLFSPRPPEGCFKEDIEDLESWECRENFDRDIVNSIEKHRLMAMDDNECSFTNTSFGCNSNSETWLSFKREIEVLRSGFYCCVAQSCESVDGIQDNSFTFCEPEDLLMF